jgi:hypothetical protein
LAARPACLDFSDGANSQFDPRQFAPAVVTVDSGVEAPRAGRPELFFA